MFLGNLSVCEQLSGEKAGKLEGSKNIKKLLYFQRRPRLLAKRAYFLVLPSETVIIGLTFHERIFSNVLLFKCLFYTHYSFFMIWSLFEKKSLDFCKIYKNTACFTFFGPMKCLWLSNAQNL